MSDETIVFPDDAGVIDVTKPPYNAKPDGVSDCTDAIQRALDDYPAKNRIIYLPVGVYRVSHQLEWGPSERLAPQIDGKPWDERWGKVRRLQILQGANCNQTIIQLVDNSPEFQKGSGKKYGKSHPGGHAVINTGGYPAQRFRNSIRNLTVNTGKGNPGAIGIQFNASNQGTLHEVQIISGDGQGMIGLDIGYCGDHGPASGRHLNIQGFDYGIWASSFNSMTLWEIDLGGQRVAGIRNNAEVLTLSRLRSSNKVPALVVGTSNESFVTLIGGSLLGSAGAADKPAISILGKPKNMHVYCRDVTVGGYGRTVSVAEDSSLGVASGNLSEWSLRGQQYIKNEGGTVTGERLAIKEAPLIPWEPIGQGWANPLKFGALGDGVSDDTAGVQQAIDSGASCVYFPGGHTFNIGTLTIPSTLRRMVGCETYLNGDSIRIIENGPPIIFERFIQSWGKRGRKPKLLIEAPRTVVVRDVTGFEIFQKSKGELFLEDVCGELFMEEEGAKTWARYFNYEPNESLGIVNDGGDLWILGSKTEHKGPKIKLINESRTELLGGFWYASFGSVVTEPGIMVIDSSLLVSTHRQFSFGKGAWPDWIKVVQGQDAAIWTKKSIDFLIAGSASRAP